MIHSVRLIAFAVSMPLLGIAPASGAVIAFDPFLSTTSEASADPATGYYLSNVDGASGSVAATAPVNNAAAQGGPIIGFGEQPWTSAVTTFRVQLGNLDIASRQPGDYEVNDGAVRVMTFKGSTGGASTTVRALKRQLNPFTASGTYYMSTATNIFTAAAPGPGGYFYLGFGNSAIDGTGLFEGIQWGYRTNAANDGIDFVLRARNAAGTAIEEVVLLANVPGYTVADTGSANQFLVVKVEVNPSGADTITCWLDPAFSTSEPAGGVVITTLNAFSDPANLTHFGSVTSLLLHSGGNNSTNRIGYFDSIALGTTYNSVVTTPGEGGNPPQPDPPLWAAGSPEAVSATRVELEGQPVVGDGFAVEYYFENVANPASNSGWIGEPYWTDRYLQPETSYSYRFKARDLSPGRIETGWSETRMVATPAETDFNPPLPNPPLWETAPVLVSTNSVYMEAVPAADPEGNGPVEYYFANITDPSRDSGWQLAPHYTDADLPDDTEFRYAFKARDASANRNETGWSAEGVIVTGTLPDGETYWQTFGQDPRNEGWHQVGSANSFDFNAQGYLLVRVFRTIEEQRFVVPLSRSYDQDHEFWLEFDWRMESVYEWPRGFLGVMDSASPNTVDLAAVYFQSRSLANNTENQRGIVYDDAGSNLWFSTSAYPREEGGVDARTRMHYFINPVGEGWMTIEITDLASGDVISNGAGKVLNPGGAFTFDSLGFANSPGASDSPQYFDRIRVDNLYFSTEMPGEDYFAGLGISRPAPAWIGDVTPPEPNPPVWEIVPQALSASRVTMRAGTVVDDLYGVQYFFENVDNPASNSGWTSERDWTEYLLQPETLHRYRFKARDLSPNRNESQWSEIASVVTPVETDVNPPLPDPPLWESEPAVLGANRIVMTAAALTDPEGNDPIQYYFANLSDPALDSGWQTSPFFENARLPYNTAYTYRFKARDGSSNRNETGWSAEVTVTTGDEPLFEDYLRLEGTWQAPATGETAHYVVYYQAEATPVRAPVIIYFINAAIPRIGTEVDTSIIWDFIQEGFLVAVVDFNGNPLAKHPLLDGDLDLFRRAVIGYGTPSLLQGTSLVPHDEDVYFVPSGWRLERNLTYWEADKHGAFGTLNRIMNTYNGYIADTFGVTPVSDPADMRGPSGELIDYRLSLDIVYPSQPDQPVPLLFDSATQSNRMRAFRPATSRIQHIGAVLNGIAFGIVDHCWNPLARDFHYGYWDGGYTLEDWNGLASITAAVRFFKAHAPQFGIDPDLFAGMGHSKGSYTITRLADPDHAGKSEHFSFSGYPSGSPELQPWPGYTSTIRTSYQSMGNGTRRTQYVTASNVPTMVACGLYDEYNQWLVFPELVSTYEGFDLNHLAFWMTDLNHTLPRNHDPILDRDRYQLFFHFLRQHLRHEADAAPQVLYILPRAGYGEVDVLGTNRYIPADELLVAGKEYMTERGGPIAVAFAPDADPATANAGGLQLVRVRDGFVVPGSWVASRGGARLSFIPDSILPDHEELEIRVNGTLRSMAGVPFAGELAHPVSTGSLSAGYDAWIFANPEIPAGFTGALDDPSGAGVTNLLSYALDLDPLRPAFSGALVYGLSGGEFHLGFPWFRDDLLYSVQSSPDLLDWQPAAMAAAPELGEDWVRGSAGLDGGTGGVFLRLAVGPAE